MRYLGFIIFLFVVVACGPNGGNGKKVEGNINTRPSTAFAADLGNRLWLDENMDGIKQVDESGLPGIVVNLWVDANADGFKDSNEAYNSVTTDDVGYYRFNALETTTNYLIEVELPLGYGISQKHSSDAKGKDWDSDINPKTGLTDSLMLTRGFYYYWIDAALAENDLASVGDKVWLDENRDGIKQNDERGFADIKVNLWHFDKASNSVDRLVATTLTDDRGNYRFTGLFPRFDYKLEFVLPDGYGFSTKNNPLAPNPDQLPDSDWDSDVNPETGFSDLLKLTIDDYNYRVDAAMFELLAQELRVSISPKHAELKTGEQISFEAEVSGSENKSVLWKTTAGLISSNGIYTAPKKAGSYVVTVTAVADSSKSATATVLVLNNEESISISISPERVELLPGQSQQFTAVVTGANDKNVVWQASEGSIDSKGIYIAPTQFGDYIVWARAQTNQNIFATARIKVINTNSCRDPLSMPKGLSEALRVSLKYFDNQTIKCNDLLKVDNLIASYADLDDISVLKFAKNLRFLQLTHNKINNIEPLKNLLKLEKLDLSDNLIGSITALLDNSGLSDGDVVNIENNCLDLSEESDDMQNIENLEERGVDVTYGGEGNCNNTKPN